MAIYHFSTKIISRSKGQSAVACAAYRAGDKLYDERQDKLQDYTKKKDVIYSEIVLTDNAPAWMNNREKLWNHILAAINAVIMFGFDKSDRYPNEKPIPFTVLFNFIGATRSCCEIQS